MLCPLWRGTLRDLSSQVLLVWCAQLPFPPLMFEVPDPVRFGNLVFPPQERSCCRVQHEACAWTRLFSTAAASFASTFVTLLLDIYNASDALILPAPLQHSRGQNKPDFSNPNSKVPSRAKTVQLTSFWTSLTLVSTKLGPSSDLSYPACSLVHHIRFRLAISQFSVALRSHCRPPPFPFSPPAPWAIGSPPMSLQQRPWRRGAESEERRLTVNSQKARVVSNDPYAGGSRDFQGSLGALKEFKTIPAAHQGSSKGHCSRQTRSFNSGGGLNAPFA